MSLYNQRVVERFLRDKTSSGHTWHRLLTFPLACTERSELVVTFALRGPFLDESAEFPLHSPCSDFLKSLLTLLSLVAVVRKYFYKTVGAACSDIGTLGKLLLLRICFTPNL